MIDARHVRPDYIPRVFDARRGKTISTLKSSRVDNELIFLFALKILDGHTGVMTGGVLFRSRVSVEVEYFNCAQERFLSEIRWSLLFVASYILSRVFSGFPFCRPAPARRLTKADQTGIQKVPMSITFLPVYANGGSVLVAHKG